MEWHFFQSTLSLSGVHSLKIKEVLNKLQNEIKEINSVKALDKVFFESQRKEHTHRERDSGGSPSLTTVQKVVSEKQDEIMSILSKTQQLRFKQITRITHLTGINTGYSPLKNKGELLL